MPQSSTTITRLRVSAGGGTSASSAARIASSCDGPPLAVVRSAERDQPAHAALVPEVDQKASDEPSEAVADDVHERRPRIAAHRSISRARGEARRW